MHRCTAAIAAAVLGFPGYCSSAATAGSPPATTRFAYRLHTGDAYRYKISALFTGHFPPFSEPTSPPINLRAVLTYAAKVKSVDARGAHVAFSVEKSVLSLLEKDPGPDAMPDPASETPFPLALSQVQKTLNVAAVVRPNGSVEAVSGGPTEAPKVNLGFDLRKLFLLIMPVTFPVTQIHTGESWTFSDGVLGHDPQATSYKATLVGMKQESAGESLSTTLEAITHVNQSEDKDGKPASTPTTTVRTTTGTVTVSGALKFKGTGRGSSSEGSLSMGQMTLRAMLTRTRLAPDPENPSAPLTDQIDVTGRLTVSISAPAPATAPRRHK